jgi:ATP-dependent Clp protease adaptor protein ClpS
MSCQCEKHSAEAIQPAGSPLPLSPTRSHGIVVVAVESTPRRLPAPAKAPQTQPAEVWKLLVLDDLNRMTYAVMVLRRVMGFDETQARRHVMEIHEAGRSVVWMGNREQAEAYMFALHQWHLTAIIQPQEAA